MDYHILALQQDMEMIEAALKQSMPRTRRPRLTPADVDLDAATGRGSSGGGVAEPSGEQALQREAGEPPAATHEAPREDHLTTCIEVEWAFSTDSSLPFAEWPL